MVDVLVIGAGPAGLCSGYYLERAGIRYLIVDRAEHLGSTWANLYPSLRLNTASFVSHMPGMRMPLRYGLLPLGSQYFEHLMHWAQRHPLRVRLSVNVLRAAPMNGGWCVETSEGTSWYRAVILATGRFSRPYLPSIPGSDAFEGNLIHAHDYHGAEPYSGHRVLVVGSGPSAADIALELLERARKPVLLAIRSDIVIARRNPYGVNDTIWKLLFDALPLNAGQRKWFNDHISFQSYRNLGELGLPLAPNREDRRGTSVPVRGIEFVQALRAGNICAVRGLNSLMGHYAQLDDSSQHEIDSVIMATGYRPALQYLDVAYATDEHGWPQRDIQAHPRSTALLGHPGLFLVGRDYRGLGAFYNIKREAREAARQIAQYLECPQTSPSPSAE